MIPEIRKKYNEQFTPEKYERLLKASFDDLGEERVFRVVETPIFVSKELKKKLIQAGEDIIDVIVRPDFKQITEEAIPENCKVPNEDDHTQFLAIDFAICLDENGQPDPQLIELQGFPSLFAYQSHTASVYRDIMWVPDGFSHLFNEHTDESYIQLLKEVVLNGHDPKNVVLMDLFPDKQKTKVDFIVTEKKIGIKAVCPTEMIKEGKDLFYMLDGEKTQIKRIYNRLIFDELDAHPDLKLPFSLTEELNIEWAGHPNWFFRISKYTMPYLKSSFVPETHFLEQMEQIPTDLENWVLKPLFSFSGQGVKFNVTLEDIESLPDRKGFILQRKVQYAPLIQSPTGPVKCEIRLLYLWKYGWKRPQLCINLSRMSKGVMIGVRYNHDLDWVGGNISFFEQD